MLPARDAVLFKLVTWHCWSFEDVELLLIFLLSPALPLLLAVDLLFVCCTHHLYRSALLLLRQLLSFLWNEWWKNMEMTIIAKLTFHMVKTQELTPIFCLVWCSHSCDYNNLLLSSLWFLCISRKISYRRVMTHLAWTAFNPCDTYSWCNRKQNCLASYILFCIHSVCSL